MINRQKKVLLVNLPFEKFYDKTIVKGVSPSTMPLGLACIGGSLLNKGHKVEIFDFNLYDDKLFLDAFRKLDPDFVGISFVTPLIKEADRISKIIKKEKKETVIIGGGPHCSSFPDSPLKETSMDIAVMGEGDFTIQEILDGKELSGIQGIAYKKNGNIIVNERREFIKDLNTLPYPAYSLFEMNKYKVSSAVARQNPVAWVETSRGCVFECIYCNKNCFGRGFRVKTAERVADEFKRNKDLGFKEIYLTDDGFTTNIKRAKKICDLLIEKEVNISWSTFNGIRVDRVDLELLKKMKMAGCYRVYYGLESGNQSILDRIKKGTTLDQARNAVKWAKEAGLEVVGYFMLGLPGETTETMQKTIDFAESLDLDLAKAGITMPLPATEMFRELEENNLIKTHEWEKFKFHTIPSEIYDHQTLSWPTIQKYYKKFYRKLYLNPKFIWKRFRYSIKNGLLLENIKMALSVDWIHVK